MMSKVRLGRTRATLLYATETGKSETFSKKLVYILQASFNTELYCMDEYNFERLISEEFVVFVTSTFGSGEPPDNGKSFWKQLVSLKETNARLQHLKYAVFALGSSQYPNYCQFGKNLDSMLTELGSERILPLEMCDEVGGQEHVFNTWLPKIYKASCSSYSLFVDENLVTTSINFTTWQQGQFRIISTNHEPGKTLTELSKLHNKRLFPVNVLTKLKLQSQGSERQTLLFRLKASDSSVLCYEPGDHIGIFPSNPPQIVDAILKRIHMKGINSHTIIQTEFQQDSEWKLFPRLPNASLKDILSYYLDITTPPTCSFLLLLSKMAKNKWDRFRLKRLSEVSNDYEDWKSHRYPNLCEVLMEFPSVQLDPTVLISELPLLQPRYYSISSSQLSTPTEVHITCALVSYRTQEGKGPIHHGVCTSFLNSIPDGEIPCYIRNAPCFHLPENRKDPIIMVGAGSGIAPFRSFWIHREGEMKKMKNSQTAYSCGDMFLFFGCRQCSEDNIYAEEISSLIKKKVLTKSFNAFSREPGRSKEYVQHKLKQESQLVLEVLENEGHIYVCGDANMASDVRNTINEILKHSTKIKTDVNLMGSNKYHEDIFGILHRN